MNAVRFGPALVAFAVATAFVAHGDVLPEFLVQLHDPNLLAVPLYAGALHLFGFPFVLALCGALSAVTVMLCAWYTRHRGASDWHATLAAVLVGLCLSGRLGVTCDPIAWCFTVIVALILESRDMWKWYALIPILLAWSLLQDGATFGAMLVVLTTLGTWLDARAWTPELRARLFVTAGAVLVSLVQFHSAPLHAYGAHWLYLDALLQGAERDRLTLLPINPGALGVLSIVILAGWYGVRRRARTSDTLIFFAALLLALADARNIPFLGILAAPLLADAVGSYYIQERSRPRASLGAYAFAVVGAASVFVAAVTLGEPRRLAWPQPSTAAGSLLAHLDRDGRRHLVLCGHPRWCDAIQTLPATRMVAVLDDRSGLATRSARSLEVRFDAGNADWQRALRDGGVDAVVVPRNGALATLLIAGGWQSAGPDDGVRALYERGAP